MRAREFLSEKKIHKTHDDHKAVMNPSLCFTDMDPGYDYYRFMMQVAASPTEVPSATEFAATPFAMPYTEIEEKMIHDSLMKNGHKHKHITPHKSGEPKNTHITSPVPQNSGARRKKK
jgi:hypothetical protein